MKNCFIKIFTLALSMLLLMGCIIGFSVSAEEAGDPAVEIVFNNLEYGDNISILYATKVDGIIPDAMKMNFYAKNEEGEYTLVSSTEKYYGVMNFEKVFDLYREFQTNNLIILQKIPTEFSQDLV